MADQSVTDPAPTTKAGGDPSQDPTSTGKGEGTVENGKAPVTLAQLEASEARQKTALATHYQGIQSLLDRQSGHLKTALEPVDRLTTTLTAMGVELEPGQIEQLRSAELTHALVSGSGGEGERADGKTALPAQEPAEPGPTDRQPGPMETLAYGMMQEQGIGISDRTDPAEFALIDQTTTDQAVFAKSVQDAINAKITRLANPGTEPAETETETDTGTKPGPGVNPRGSGTKPANLIPDKTPSGARQPSINFLEAGYSKSDDFPSDE